MPLVRVLADMQILGFKVDKEKLMQFSKKLDEKLINYQVKYIMAGEEFNINSPKQLGIILLKS